MGWLILLAGIVLLMVAVMLNDVQIRIVYSREKENDYFRMDVHGLFGLVRYRYEIPTINYRGMLNNLVLKTESKMEGKNNPPDKRAESINRQKLMEWYEEAKLFLSQITGFNDWMKGTMAHVRCERLLWTTELGVGDAAHTAVLTGVGWTLKSSLLGYGFQFIQLKTKPNIMVTPFYNQELFRTRFVGLLKIRTWYGVLAGIYLLARGVKGKVRRKTPPLVRQKA